MKLRSPMTAIHAGTRLLLEGILGPSSNEQRNTLDIMEQSSREVIRMISGLLDLAKFESGMMEYHFASVDPMRQVHAAISESPPLCGARTHTDHGKRTVGAGEVRADEMRIHKCWIISCRTR